MSSISISSECRNHMILSGDRYYQELFKDLNLSDHAKLQAINYIWCFISNQELYSSPKYGIREMINLYAHVSRMSNKQRFAKIIAFAIVNDPDFSNLSDSANQYYQEIKDLVKNISLRERLNLLKQFTYFSSLLKFCPNVHDVVNGDSISGTGKAEDMIARAESFPPSFSGSGNTSGESSVNVAGSAVNAARAQKKDEQFGPESAVNSGSLKSMSSSDKSVRFIEHGRVSSPADDPANPADPLSGVL